MTLEIPAGVWESLCAELLARRAGRRTIARRISLAEGRAAYASAEIDRPGVVPWELAASAGYPSADAMVDAVLAYRRNTSAAMVATGGGQRDAAGRFAQHPGASAPCAPSRVATAHRSRQ